MFTDLTNLSANAPKHCLTTGGGPLAIRRGVGNITMEYQGVTFNLEEVLYCPSCPVNATSVPRLNAASGRVTFAPDSALIELPDQTTRIVTFTTRSNCYTLQGDFIWSPDPPAPE